MENKSWHQLTEEELLGRLGSSPDNGLDQEEAARRLAEHGRNELTEGERLSPIKLFLNQFKDFMVLVLIGATLISGLLGEYLDAITIIAIIFINSILGFVQEFRAERSLRALKELSAPTANVLRGGRVIGVPASELVAGDIVLLESGDRIPADLRFLKANSCQAEESALTGESVPVSKHCSPILEDELPLGRYAQHGLYGHDAHRRYGIRHRRTDGDEHGDGQNRRSHPADR